MVTGQNDLAWEVWAFRGLAERRIATRLSAYAALARVQMMRDDYHAAGWVIVVMLSRPARPSDVTIRITSGKSSSVSRSG